MIYPIDDVDAAELKARFQFHRPKKEQLPKHARLHEHAYLLAGHVMRSCPPSYERDAALKHIEQSLFWADCSINRRE